MGYKGKSNIEYQKEYYYKNREQRLLKMRQYNKNNYDTIQEYQRQYYLRYRDEISLIRAEHYINKKQESNKNKNNVVIASNKIIISIIED
jgi:hypothetical protein